METVHVVSNAAGVILMASSDKARCEAYVAGCLGSTVHMMEPWRTPSNDPATLYRVPVEDSTTSTEPWRLAYSLTTLRLT